MTRQNCHLWQRPVCTHRSLSAQPCPRFLFCPASEERAQEGPSHLAPGPHARHGACPHLLTSSTSPNRGLPGGTRLRRQSAWEGAVAQGVWFLSCGCSCPLSSRTRAEGQLAERPELGHTPNLLPGNPPEERSSQAWPAPWAARTLPDPHIGELSQPERPWCGRGKALERKKNCD